MIPDYLPDYLPDSGVPRMAVTKREMADKLGVSKRTIANYIEKLGLGNHVTRTGNTDLLDDYAASLIAARVGGAAPPKAAPTDGAATTSDAVVAALNGRIADLKERNEGLEAELADLRASRDREVESLRSQLADANARAADLAERVAGIAERQQAIAAVPWWRRGRVAMRLLGPGE